MTASKLKTILVVDDEEDLLLYLSSLFSDNGYRVITAADGREGFVKALRERPDLITLDVSMPEESGVRMFQRLRSNEDTAGVPVIMVTGIPKDFKPLLEALEPESAPQGFFEKPIDRDVLMNRVRQLIG